MQARRFVVGLVIVLAARQAAKEIAERLIPPLAAMLRIECRSAPLSPINPPSYTHTLSLSYTHTRSHPSVAAATLLPRPFSFNGLSVLSFFRFLAFTPACSSSLYARCFDAILLPVSTQSFCYS